MPAKKKLNNTSNVLVRPITAILCDDIRQESNGKEIIIGVYSGAIKIKVQPGQKLDDSSVLTLSLWIPFTFENSGQAEIEFKIETPGGGSPLIVNSKIDVRPVKGDLPTIKIVGFPVFLKEEGHIKVSYRNAGVEVWTVLREATLTFDYPISP